MSTWVLVAPQPKAPTVDGGVRKTDLADGDDALHFHSRRSLIVVLVFGRGRGRCDEQLFFDTGGHWPAPFVSMEKPRSI